MTSADASFFPEQKALSFDIPIDEMGSENTEALFCLGISVFMDCAPRKSGNSAGPFLDAFLDGFPEGKAIVPHGLTRDGKYAMITVRYVF